MAERLGVGTRTLRAVARDEVGMSPVPFLGARRLQRALARAVDGGGRLLSRVAVASGYHDHPHMVREFRALLGEPPGAFLARGRVALHPR